MTVTCRPFPSWWTSFCHVCVHVHIYIWAHVFEGQRLMVDVFLNSASPCFPRQSGSLLWLPSKLRELLFFRHPPMALKWKACALSIYAWLLTALLGLWALLPFLGCQALYRRSCFPHVLGLTLLTEPSHPPPSVSDFYHFMSFRRRWIAIFVQF